MLERRIVVQKRTCQTEGNQRRCRERKRLEFRGRKERVLKIPPSSININDSGSKGGGRSWFQPSSWGKVRQGRKAGKGGTVRKRLGL